MTAPRNCGFCTCSIADLRPQAYWCPAEVLANGTTRSERACAIAALRGQEPSTICRCGCGRVLKPGRPREYRELATDECIARAESEGRLNGNRVGKPDPYLAEPPRAQEIEDRRRRSRAEGAQEVDSAADSLASLMSKAPHGRDHSSPKKRRNRAERATEGGIYGAWDSIAEEWRSAQTWEMGLQSLTDERGRFISRLNRVDRLLKKSGNSRLRTRMAPLPGLPEVPRLCPQCGNWLPRGKRGNRCADCDKTELISSSPTIRPFWEKRAKQHFPQGREETASAVAVTILPPDWINRNGRKSEARELAVAA